MTRNQSPKIEHTLKAFISKLTVILMENFCFCSVLALNNNLH